jgi:hypothetical protein
LGISWREAGRHTLPEFYAQCRYWRKHPPSHKLIAAWVGYKPPPEAPEPANFAALQARYAAWFAEPERFFEKAAR